MVDYEDTVEWDAKGAFSTPASDITETIEWTAKGTHAISADLTDVIEWTAAGEFTPPHSFIFIDLR